MIFQYKAIIRHPTIFKAVTGLTRVEFDQYIEPLAIEVAQTENQRLANKANRKRVVGGGRNHDLQWTDQMLLTLVWLRIYPTHEVLGYLFGISDSSSYRIVKRCLPILAESGRRQIKKSRAHATRKRGYNLAEIYDQVPGLAVVVDAFEQQIEKPTQREEADQFYSKKKKQHSLKSQIAVDVYTGEILDVADSLNGRRQDKGYFNESGILDRLPDNTSFMGDLGYQGLEKELSRGRTPRKKPRSKPRPAEDIEYNMIFSKARVIVENSIARLRIYDALLVRDRHHRNWHTDRVLAVTGIVNFTKRHRYVY